MSQAERAPWSRIILIYLIGVFGMMVVSAALPALGGIAAEFRPPSPSTIGWVMSAPALAAALASLAIGALVDRFGDRRMMLIGGALVLLGDIGVVTVHDMTLLLAWRIAAGLGYVCIVVAAVTMIMRMTSGRARTAALALWSTVIPASFVIASLYGAAFGHGGGWRTIFLLHAGGVALLMALAIACLTGGVAAETGRSRLNGIGQVLRSPWPYVLGASFAAAAFLQTGFVSSLPRLLAGSIGASEAQVHSFNALAMVCNMVGAFSFGLLFNRGLKPWQMGVASVAMCGLAGLGLVLAPTSLMLAIVMNCALMFGLGILVGMWALLPAVTPSPACTGAASGLITQITLLGVLFGPPVAFQALHAGPTTMLLFLAAALLVCMIGWPVWRRPLTAAVAAAH
ncbi:MFS transporter [Sphingobium sp. YR768]|uniref:MFS transporter n=1 Tax=Sphingobium sp. YR768 TaxID=1884365 RepID=UPI0008B4F4A6|nr:MFS transporter [Sphingobium sp. YR768]SER34679.1 Predicted arabinose efflux permease, MFS family [Sphingobium sp. YR768]